MFYLSLLPPRPRLSVLQTSLYPAPQLCQTCRKPHKYLVQCDGCGSVYGLQTGKKARVTCSHVTRGSDVTEGRRWSQSPSPHIGPRHLLLRPRPRSQMSQMSPVCPRARVLGSVTVNLSWSQPAEPPGHSAFSKQTSNTALWWNDTKKTRIIRIINLFLKDLVLRGILKLYLDIFNDKIKYSQQAVGRRAVLTWKDIYIFCCLWTGSAAIQIDRITLQLQQQKDY